MKAIKKLFVIILLLVLAGMGKQHLFAHPVVTHNVVQQKAFSTLSEESNNIYSDSEVNLSYAYSAPSIINNARLQRRVSYADASSSFFIRILLGYYSSHTKLLTDIALKYSLEQKFFLYSYASQYYIFGLRKILI